jgi:hypothetical protein
MAVVRSAKSDATQHWSGLNGVRRGYLRLESVLGVTPDKGSERSFGMARYDLSEAEWRLIEPLLPNKPRAVARWGIVYPF